MITEEAKKVLLLLQHNWIEADRAESDPEEHRAFRPPILMLEGVLVRLDATHDDIRLIIPVCPAYPNWGRYALEQLADAMRDRKRVLVFERGDGAMRWDVE
jgi:hypothetical protein